MLTYKSECGQDSKVTSQSPNPKFAVQAGKMQFYCASADREKKSPCEGEVSCPEQMGEFGLE